MARQGNALDADVQRLLDRLKVTPEQLFHGHGGPASHAVSGVGEARETGGRLVRPSRFGSLFTGLWEIDLDAFDTALASSLDALGIGYCYMMRRQGKLVHARSSGWAQLPGDGQVGWFFHVPMAIASPTKLITAIAVVRLLRSLGIAAASPIGAYLPAYWNAPASTRALTFDNLLRHESGLATSFGDSTQPGPNDFFAARDQARAGPAGSGPWPYNYKNANYVILRVLVATLQRIPDASFAFPQVPTLFGASIDTTDESWWDVVTAQAYASYVNENIFAPAGVDPRFFFPAENAAKAYATPPAGIGSQVVNDATNAGPRGWHLSIAELMDVLGEFRRGGSMMAPWQAEQLMASGYGLDAPLATQAGPVYRKGGRSTWNTQGMDSAIYLMPGGIEFAIFTNSWDGTQGGHLGNIPTLITNSVRFIL